VHGDLQPRNILLNRNCDLKIKLEGGPRVHGPWMTRYASTQYYMAPEVMLIGEGYDEFIDIWSAGCIFAELLQGKALFPGQNDIHQFHIITEMLGTPSETVTKRMTSGNVCLCSILC
jgi:p38 MAP kinase